jgi:DNA primase
MEKHSKIDLNELIEKVDIVSLVEEYNIPLEQSGDNYVALCPFHPDNRTKSFFVFPHTNTWHCFGCKKGSSVFDFIMEMEHKSFWEAVHFLAEKVGYADVFSLDSLRKRLDRLETKTEDIGISKFKEAREIVESQIYKKMKEAHNKAKFAGKEGIMRIDSLWKWYDESQMWFSLYACHYKSGENIDLEFLIQKLHSFYSKFLEKLEKI